MTDYYVPKNQRALFANGWAWIIACLIVVGLLAAVLFGLRWATAPARGKLSARQQIQSGAYRIQAYDHFFDLCASVQSTEQVLAASMAELETAPADDQQRVRTNITGLLATRAQAVAQYNADARKDYTLGQFKASKLPYALPPTYSKEEPTSCGS